MDVEETPHRVRAPGRGGHRVGSEPKVGEDDCAGDLAFSGHDFFGSG